MPSKLSRVLLSNIFTFYQIEIQHHLFVSSIHLAEMKISIYSMYCSPISQLLILANQNIRNQYIIASNKNIIVSWSGCHANVQTKIVLNYHYLERIFVAYWILREIKGRILSVNVLPWEIGQSHVTSVISFRMVKLSARLFPTPSTPLSFFHRPRGSDIITVYFNLHHRHLRNDKSRWTSIPTILYHPLLSLYSSVTHLRLLFHHLALSFFHPKSKYLFWA